MEDERLVDGSNSNRRAPRTKYSCQLLTSVTVFEIRVSSRPPFSNLPKS